MHPVIHFPIEVQSHKWLGMATHSVASRRTTVGRTPLDEWSARDRDLYLTRHNTHNRQTSMPPVGFEATTPAGERPQTYNLGSSGWHCVWWHWTLKELKGEVNSVKNTTINIWLMMVFISNKKLHVSAYSGHHQSDIFSLFFGTSSEDIRLTNPAKNHPLHNIRAYKIPHLQSQFPPKPTPN